MIADTRKKSRYFSFLDVSPVVSNVGLRTFACGGAGLLGFVVLLLLAAEQDSRYVEDKSDQVQVCKLLCIGVWVRRYFGRQDSLATYDLYAVDRGEDDDDSDQDFLQPRFASFVCHAMLFCFSPRPCINNLLLAHSGVLQEYDQTYYPRLIVVIILSLGALLGFGGLCVTHIGKPLHVSAT